MSLFRFPLLVSLLGASSILLTNAFASDLKQEIHHIENSLRSAIKIKGEKEKVYTLQERMAHYKVAGVSVAVVKEGKLHWAKGYGIANSSEDRKVDENTLFQAGSISKPVAALAALKLAENGKVDLDADVNQYLKNWSVTVNEFTRQQPVTLRMLMTHTAGMTVHGFPGYANGEEIPSTTEVLEGKGNTDVVTVDTLPGSTWRYSGGGYTVMQKVVEDVSNQPFEQYVQDNILNPMGMSKSTYAQPIDPARQQALSAAYDNQGNMLSAKWHNYPEKAAAGLWTTPSDLTHYIVHMQDIVQSRKPGLFTPETMKDMFSPDQNNWGLGPEMRKVEGHTLFQHGGKNAGFTNHFMAFADKGEGMVIMTNSDGAGPLISELQIALSELYGWGTHNRTELSPIQGDKSLLNAIAGTYEFEEKVPGIDQYLIHIRVVGNRIHIRDDNDGSTNIMLPVSTLEFANIASGRKAVFEQDPQGKIIGFVWSDRWRFSKLN